MTFPIAQSLDTLASRTSTSPFITIIMNRPPNGNDGSAQGYLVGQRWIDTLNNNQEWFLLGFISMLGIVQANWVMVSSGSVPARFPWIDVTASTQLLAVQEGYITDNAGGVTYALPMTAIVGDIIRIAGKLGMWTIDQNAGQQIDVGSASSSIGVVGSVSSTDPGDSVELLCIVGGAATVFRAISFVGNLTVT
jgi:hypothetical protein